MTEAALEVSRCEVCGNEYDKSSIFWCAHCAEAEGVAGLRDRG